MEKQFNLILTNRWKAAGVVVGSIVLLGLVAAVVIGTVGRYSPVVAGVSGVGLLVGWIFWFIPQAAHRFCAELAVAVLNEGGLTVHYQATGAVRHIGFADMASYSFAFNEDFTVRPRPQPASQL